MCDVILHKEEDAAQKFLDVAGVMFVQIDTEGKVTLVNKKGCQILGYEASEIIGRDWFSNFIPERNRQHTREVFFKLISGELRMVEYVENPVINSSGEERIIRWHNSILRDEHGRIAGTLSSGGDITERVKAQAELARSEQRFRKFFENDPDYCYIISPEGTILEVNRAALKILGYEKEKIVGQPIDTIYAPESRARRRQLLEGLEKSGEIRDEEIVVITRYGERRIVSFSTAPVLDETGKLLHSISIQKDITDRKRTQEALTDSEAKYYSLIENIPAVVWTSDEEGNTVFISSGVEEIYGYTQSEIYKAGKELWFGRIHPDDVGLVKKAFQDIFEKREPLNVEYRIRKKNGEWIWLQDRSIGAYVKGDTKFADGVFFEVTDRKEAEKKLMAYQNDLRSLASKLMTTEESQRRQIAADLHDNVSQALSLTINQLRKLRKSMSPADKTALDETCRTIEKTIQNVQELTFDLASPTLYKIGLEAAISELLNEQLRNRYGLTCILSDDKKEKPLDDDTRVLLYRAVRELLINVIKHARATRVEVDIQRKNGTIQIIISDDGIGFDTKEVESSIRRRGGFGLFNIRERIDYIGGSFKIYSKPGKGSRFVLTAPMKTETH